MAKPVLKDKAWQVETVKMRLLLQRLDKCKVAFFWSVPIPILCVFGMCMCPNKEKISAIFLMMAIVGPVVLFASAIPVFICASKLNSMEFRLNLFCPDSGMHINWSDPWFCGYCRTKNEPLRWYHLLDKCGGCKKSSDYLICPHCNIAILLANETGNLKHAATTKDPLENNQSGSAELPVEVSRKREMEKREHAILITQLDAKLANAEKELRFARGEKKSLEQDLEDTKARFLKVKALHQAEIEKAKIEYADNENMFNDTKEVLDRWKESKSLN